MRGRVARGLRLLIGSCVAAGAIAACSSSNSGTGGGVGGHTQLADGSLGSACGQVQCQASLTCFVAQGVPDGYCTKTCASDADCGANGTCFNTSAGPGCFLRCASDAACRTGYTCQQGGCAPGPAPGPGTDGGPNPGGNCIDNATLTTGWWSPNNGGATLSEIQFNADGTVVEDVSSPVTTITNNGNWTLACPTISVTFTGGASPITFTIANNGSYYLNDGTDNWAACPGGTKCF